MVESQTIITDNSEVNPARLLNINIGVLGHIDSGKTSLCKAMSTVASTAGFDKSPQSKERGITLDLGFSAFVVAVPDWLKEKEPLKLKEIDHIQFTLVDCPGHASLMKTVIGGASIIDLMILVVDSQKLIQTQTAECIVLGEILMDKLIVAFNKTDLFKGEPEKLALQLKKIQMQISKTKFGDRAKVVQVNAVPASDSETDLISTRDSVRALVDQILNTVEIPDRSSGSTKDFLFSIDHCFQIKGQGTVLTGTCLAGSAKIGDIIEFPALKQEKKIRSIQMFRKPVTSIKQGDRAGICVPQLDADLIERGIAATPRSIKSSDLAIVLVKRIPYFSAGEIKSKGKYHISMGHQTGIGSVTFFSCESTCDQISSFNKNNLIARNSIIPFDTKKQYKAEEILPKPSKMSEESKETEVVEQNKEYYAIVKLEKEVLAQEQTLFIGSKLDTDTSMKTVRLAFYGQVLVLLQNSQSAEDRQQYLENIQIIKEKVKFGKVDKVVDQQNLHIRDLFSKETSLKVFDGLRVILTETKQSGRIEGTFGKSGKLKVRLDEPIDSSIDLKTIVNSQVELHYKKNMMKKKANKFK